MRLLVAVEGGIAGELAIPIARCDSPDCSCGDGWVGVTSAQLVTVAEVRTLDIARGELEDLARAYLEGQGWADDPEMAAELVDELAAQAAGQRRGRRLRRVDDEVVPD